MGQDTPVNGNRAYRIYYATVSWIVTGFVHLFIFLFITGIAAAIIIANFYPDTVLSTAQSISILAVGSIPAIAVYILKWRGARWRKANPEKHLAEMAAKTAKREAAAEAEKNRPPNALEKAIAKLFEMAVWLVVAGVCVAVAIVGLYLAYQQLSSISVPGAILIGAVFIGFCILKASGR